MSFAFISCLAAIAVCALAGGLLPLVNGGSNRSLILPVSFAGGAVLTWFFLIHASAAVTGGALALSAGTFIAIATSDLLPQIRHSEDGRNLPLVLLFAGLLVCWLSSLFAF